MAFDKAKTEILPLRAKRIEEETPTMETLLLNKDEIKKGEDTQDFKWLSIEDIKNGVGDASPNVKQLVEKNF